MEINKQELQTMIREFWARNNDTCERVTIVFLKRIGLTELEIKTWLGYPTDEKLPKTNQEDIDDFIEELHSTEDYYD
jgi:hypothetical protein